MSLRPDVDLNISWNIVALGFSVTGSVFTALGLISIKLANIDMEKPENDNKIIWFHKYMLIGMLFFTISQILNGFALALGNIILISSTSCITIVFSAIFAPIILKERFEFMLDGITILLVGTGSIVAIS